MIQVIDYFDKMYCSQKYNNKGDLKLGFLHSVVRAITRKVSNVILPIVLKNTCKTILRPSTNEEVILSLTSFPLRTGKLWMVLESLLRQTIKPSRIIVWLSKCQFPTEESVPVSLLNYREKGVDIEFVEEDYKSHKKYHYVVNRFPNSVLVTLDDDILYPSTMLENLLVAHHKYPNAVIARYAYKMSYEDNGTIAPYSKWKRIMFPQPPSHNVFFGSGGGTLFPVGAFNEDVKDIELARTLCPTADDVFLNAQCQLINTPIVVVDSKVALLNVQYKEDKRLATANIDEGNANDVQIAKVNSYYGKKIF